MNRLQIESTINTPAIDFDFSRHTFAIRGESNPNDVERFYTPVLSALQAYLAPLSGQVVTFDFELSAFNTATSAVLLRLFDRLEECVDRGGNTVVLNWYQEPDDEYLSDKINDLTEHLSRITLRIRELRRSS